MNNNLLNKKRIILHVDMDAFFPSVEVLIHPEYKGKPLIVGGDPKKRGVVSSCSYEARKYGVHSAMPLSKAYQLCPEGIFVKGSMNLYSKYSKLIKEIFFNYSPKVQMVSLDEAYIDLTGCETLYGDIGKTAEKLQNDIMETTGLSCSIGIARCKVVAKVASDYKKPGGITNVLDKEREFLYPLKIRSLPLIGRKMFEKLSKMGIHTIGQLSKIDSKIMEKIFGKIGIVVLNYSNGYDNSEVEVLRKIKSIGREITFPEDINDYNLLRQKLVYVLEKALYDLRNQKLKAKCLTLKLRNCNFKTFSKSITIEPGNSFLHFYSKLNELFLSTWEKKSKVRLIGVRFTSFVENENLELFESEKIIKNKVFNDRLDLLRNKYGFNIIKPASII